MIEYSKATIDLLEEVKETLLDDMEDTESNHWEEGLHFYNDSVLQDLNYKAHASGVCGCLPDTDDVLLCDGISHANIPNTFDPFRYPRSLVENQSEWLQSLFGACREDWDFTDGLEGTTFSMAGWVGILAIKLFGHTPSESVTWSQFAAEIILQGNNPGSVSYVEEYKWLSAMFSLAPAHDQLEWLHRICDSQGKGLTYLEALAADPRYPDAPQPRFSGIR